MRNFNHQYIVVGGHISYYLLPSNLPDPHMINFLRDPEKITISTYFRSVLETPRQEFVDLHAFDYPVYEFAQKLFDRRWKQYFADVATRDLEENENRLEEQENELFARYDGKSPYLKT